LNKNQLHVRTHQSELKTDRLLLRNLIIDDYLDLFELRFHPEVIKHIKRKKVDNKLELKRFISEKLQDIKEDNLFFWGMSKTNNPKLIGTICLWNFNAKKTVAEIGYELRPEFHGKGLMSEAMGTVLDYGFRELKLKSIEAFTSKYNESSKSLLNKFDFKLEINRIDEGFPNNIIFTKQNA